MFYRHVALARTLHTVGTAALRINGAPPTFVYPLSTDALHKRPERPFLDQHEWRIAIFTNSYIDNDP
ncbi:MAG: hypothetical protein ABL997_03700 [Planctomycetota bacterium]